VILSDVSIRRPVFAAVLSLLLLILGIMAALRLPMRELPDVDAPIVSVQTYYRGASAAVIESRITQVLEDALAGLEGVEKLTSSSSDEYSRITVEFSVDRDLDAAASDVRDRISRAVGRLPEEADPPQVAKANQDADPIMGIAISSSRRSPLELTEFAERVLVDRFATIPGVAVVNLWGGRRYAMRIWLDRDALAARQLTVTDVENALRRENIELPAGRIESLEREFSLRTDTALRTEEDFRQLPIGRSPDGYVVRLGEVAQVRIGAEDERSIMRMNGQNGLMMAIIPHSKANLFELSRRLHREIEEAQKAMPEDITLGVNIDFSVFIAESMKKVGFALLETMVSVLIVIFLFLGTARATFIPAVTIPVSILAAAVVMAALGYSLNTLTLLGIVLAIGLVVDDAIVVLENIVRRIELGEPALLAALNGSREIGFAVIATTLVLVAVFVPVSYLEGNLGRMFGEFGITVAAAVAFSALVALTLTPMMSSKLFERGIRRGRVATAVDEAFKRLSAAYRRLLTAALPGYRPLVILATTAGTTAVVVALTVFGWPVSWFKVPQEFAPAEDRGVIPVNVTAPEGASLAYLDRHLAQVEAILAEEVERGNARRVIARTGGFGGGDVNSGVVFMPLVLWDEREESAPQIIQRVQQRTADIPGVRIFAMQPPSLGVRGAGRPLQVVIGGPEYSQLVEWRDRIMARVAQENPRIINLDSNYQERKPRLAVRIDRNKAADLGVSLQAVGRTLEAMLGSRIVTTFISGGEEYNVVVQAADESRSSVSELGNLYVRSEQTGALVPLSAIVEVEEAAGPTALNRFDRLRSITLSANLAPGYTLGEALQYMERVIAEELPPTAYVAYDGESREFKRSGGALWVTFGFALLIVYLVLAAQFESFVHPVVILATVPLAVIGALIGLWLFGASINVFSQIGAIMLVGIACKNGILIVEFANQLRDRGVEFMQAVTEAAIIRLRPVLMTSFCTAFGAIPLMISTGAGAQSRQAIGATVFFGVIVSVVLTMFVVPAVYALIARNTRSPQHVSRLIEKLRQAASRHGSAELPEGQSQPQSP
jgi:Cation/multidrug efflux pump